MEDGSSGLATEFDATAIRGLFEGIVDQLNRIAHEWDRGDFALLKRTLAGMKTNTGGFEQLALRERMTLRDMLDELDNDLIPRALPYMGEMLQDRVVRLKGLVRLDECVPNKDGVARMLWRQFWPDSQLYAECVQLVPLLRAAGEATPLGPRGSPPDIPEADPSDVDATALSAIVGTRKTASRREVLLRILLDHPNGEWVKGANIANDDRYKSLCGKNATLKARLGVLGRDRKAMSDYVEAGRGKGGYRVKPTMFETARRASSSDQ